MYLLMKDKSPIELAHNEVESNAFMYFKDDPYISKDLFKELSSKY